MRPLRVSNSTRVLAEGQDEYLSLPIRDVPDAEGRNQMMSVWEPSPEELRQLNEGGAVVLVILGEVHPPVAITTQPAPE